MKRHTQKQHIDRCVPCALHVSLIRQRLIEGRFKKIHIPLVDEHKKVKLDWNRKRESSLFYSVNDPIVNVKEIVQEG